MKYDKYDRQAIKRLSDSSRALFEVIEREEKGEMINVPGICLAFAVGPKFVTFSCLHGDGKRESLEDNLGMVFEKTLKAKMESLMSQLKIAGYNNHLLVIVDDTEPVRFWKWKTSQEEITTWLKMVIEEADIPSDWDVLLWSDIEKDYVARELPSYEQFYADHSGTVTQSVPYYNLFRHVKMFPNKGLKDVSVHEAVTGKLVQYKYECLILNLMMPNLILIQTETPWEVKDPLFRNPMTNSTMKIIHPFQRWR